MSLLKDERTSPSSGGNAQTHLEAQRTAGTGRDLSKISLVVSLLSLVLVAIFFFGLNRNLSGLTREIQDYQTVKNTVTSLDAYVDDVVSQMGRVNTQLLNIDEQRREVVLDILMDSMLDDMLQKISFMQSQIKDNSEVARLEQVRGLLLQLRHPSPVENPGQGTSAAAAESSDIAVAGESPDVSVLTEEQTASSVESDEAPAQKASVPDVPSEAENVQEGVAEPQ